MNICFIIIDLLCLHGKHYFQLNEVENSSIAHCVSFYFHATVDAKLQLSSNCVLIQNKHSFQV